VSESFGEEVQQKGGFDPSAPLTDRERNQILRLLSEPMEFPLQFRNWVKNYIETVGISLPRSAIVGLTNKTTTLSMQEGLIFLVPEGKVPAGTVPLRGEMASREEHPYLARLIGEEQNSFMLPSIPAPEGLVYVITTGGRPEPVRES
jgi:hypothetical protein